MELKSRLAPASITIRYTVSGNWTGVSRSPTLTSSKWRWVRVAAMGPDGAAWAAPEDAAQRAAPDSTGSA